MKATLTIYFIIFSIFRLLGQSYTKYEYDQLDRLKKIINSNSSIVQYEYDIHGNRISKTVLTSNFAVIPTQLAIAAATNSRTTFSIKCTGSWNIKVDQLWITANVTNGSGDATITLTATANISAISRLATITVISGTITQTVQVIQLSATPTLEINIASMGFREVSGLSSSFSISSNMSWTIATSENWLSLSKTSGSNNAEITVTVNSANTATTDRTAIITVTGTDGTKKTIQVIQSGTNGTDLSNGLVAYYPFNGNANDESGNGNHGTLFNTNEFTEGVAGSAVKVKACGYTDSCGGRILFPKFDFNSMNQFTLSLWVKEESQNYQDGEGYIFFGDHGNGHISILHSPGNNDSIYFSVGKNKHAAVKFNSPNKWQHYTLIYNSGIIKAYVGGNLVGSFIDNVYAATSDGGLSTHWWWSGTTSTRLTGTFDEVRIYNRALTDTEVTSLYNSIKQTDVILLESSHISIFPNPTNSILTITGLKTNQKNKIAIYSVDGKLIKRKTIVSATDVIDISNQVSGIYFLKVNEQIFKIVKE